MFEPRHLKLATLGSLAALIAISAALVIAALQQLPATYGIAVRSLTTSNGSYSVSTSSFTTSPSPSNNNGSGASEPTSDTTTNWAGYVSTGESYSAVSGSWKVPTVTPADDSLSADATWIGIGGDTSNDLIQIGTQNMVESGQVTTGTFYERLPDTSETVPGVNVNAGDAITASINEVASGEWTISISDLTNGESYTNTVGYDSSESSAEWVEEAPSSDGGVMPLDNFGTVDFTNGSTTENGNTVSIAGSHAQALTMDNQIEQALTSTSALSDNGSSFTVSRTNTSSAVSADGNYFVMPSGYGWSRHEPGRDAWGYGYRNAQPGSYGY